MRGANVDTNRGEFAADGVSLAEMRSGESGRIVGIHGGYGMARKLDSMGIVAGKEVTKISAQWMRGPVLLRHGNTQVAVGFGMASRVLVEVNGDGK